MASVTDDYRGEGGLWDRAILPAATSAVANASPMDFASLPLQALLYSPETEAALFPASAARALKGATMRQQGLSPRELLRREGLAFDGTNWNEFERDIIKPNTFGKLKGSSNYTRPLSDVMSLGRTNPNINPRHRAMYNQNLRDTSITPRDMDQGHLGRYEPETKDIYVNKRLPASLTRDTIRHEGQHSLDDLFGRSYGADLDLVKDFLTKRGKNHNDAFSYYRHNTGEMRGRLNEKLNNMFDSGVADIPDAPSSGLSSLFNRAIPFMPERIWK